MGFSSHYPSTKFCGNPFNSFCNPADRKTDKTENMTSKQKNLISDKTARVFKAVQKM